MSARVFGGSCSGFNTFIQPDRKYIFNFSYITGDFFSRFQWRHIPSLDLFPGAGNVVKSVSASNYLDLNFDYTFAERYTLFLGIDNITDEEPPILGFSLATIGDLDGDGILDLVTSDAAGALVLVMGGGTGGAWDSTFAVGMTLAAITFFRRFFNKKSGLGTFLAQQSYAVYIIHIPLVIFIAYGLRGIEMASMLKFGLAALIIVPTCFIVAAIIRKIPGVSRII